MGKYATGFGQPASSDPATIYRQLLQAIRTNDKHDAKIGSQKTTIKSLAVKWYSDGAISQDHRDEILARVKRASFSDWRPLIFAIPYQGLASRVKAVPLGMRAGQQPEYIIEDLMSSEFHIIEPS